MFVMLRDLFAKGDAPLLRRGLGRRAVALFAFEFVVVLLGVLAAQMAQAWFADRADRKRAGEALRQMEAEAQSFQAVADYRVQVHDCEMQRIQSVFVAAQRGGSVAPKNLSAPIMPMPSVTEWTEETKAAVLRHFGRDQLRSHESLALLARMINERQRTLEDQWATFRLLAPSSGTAGETDRAAIRLASARIAGLLNHIDNNAQYVMAFPVKSKAEAGKTLKMLAEMDKNCGKSVKVPGSAAASQKPAVSGKQG